MVDDQTIVLFRLITRREQTDPHEQAGQIVDSLRRFDHLIQILDIDTIVDLIALDLRLNSRIENTDAGIEPAETMKPFGEELVRSIVRIRSDVDGTGRSHSILETLETLSLHAGTVLAEHTRGRGGSYRPVIGRGLGNIARLRCDRTKSTSSSINVLSIRTDRVHKRMETLNTKSGLRMRLPPRIVSKGTVIQRLIKSIVADLRERSIGHLARFEEFAVDIAGSSRRIVELVEHGSERFTVGTMPKDGIEQIARIYGDGTCFVRHLTDVGRQTSSWHHGQRAPVIVILLESIEEGLKESVWGITDRGVNSQYRNTICDSV